MCVELRRKFLGKVLWNWVPRDILLIPHKDDWDVMEAWMFVIANITLAVYLQFLFKPFLLYGMGSTI